MDKFIIDQYLFETEEEYNLALEEKKKIQYIEEKMDYKSVNNVITIYKKMVDLCLFQTPFGYSYLESLRKFLEEQDVHLEELPVIPIKTKVNSREREKILRENRKMKDVILKRRKQNRISMTLCIILGALVIALFLVAFTSDIPNILNYKHNLQNKYSAWEQELRERENILREKEMQIYIEE